MKSRLADRRSKVSRPLAIVAMPVGWVLAVAAGSDEENDPTTQGIEGVPEEDGPARSLLGCSRVVISR